MAEHEEKLREMDVHLGRLLNRQNEEDLRIFKTLYGRFLHEPTTIDWTMDKDSQECRGILDRLVVVKLNGGLGTTMGCSGPKSLIEVRSGLSFLDFALEQNKRLNDLYGTRVPLYLMNSFNTSRETDEALSSKSHQLLENVYQFSQSKCPRIYSDSLLPVPDCNNRDDPAGWYPPGHGNVFESMANTGVLEKCLADGRDIAFFSNIDNTGACVDMRIAKGMANGLADYLMEVTPKTQTDIKGGTLIELNARLMHLEIPQVPADRVDEFCSLQTFKMFNTNNIWVNLRAVKEKLEREEGMTMEIIANKKNLSNGRQVIQLETSIGGAVRNFPNRAVSVNVGRHRFLPVKSTQELLALMSNAYAVDEKSYVLKLTSATRPIISLSKEFSSIGEFSKRFASIPDLSQLTALKVEGDVRFGKNIRLIGNVSVIAKGEEKVTVVDGSILEGPA